MKILFVHQNFPGQYLSLARHLGATGQHEVIFLTQRQDANLPGVRKIVYRPQRAITPGVHHYLRETEAAILNGQEVVRAALSLRNSGFVPDVMLGHNGWGEIWYLKEVFPNTPLIGYFEFFYRQDGADVGLRVRAGVSIGKHPPHQSRRAVVIGKGRRRAKDPRSAIEIYSGIRCRRMAFQFRDQGPLHIPMNRKFALGEYVSHEKQPQKGVACGTDSKVRYLSG